MIIALHWISISLDFNISQISLGHLMMIGGIVLYSYGNLLMQHQCKKEDSLPFTFSIFMFELLSISVNYFIYS